MLLIQVVLNENYNDETNEFLTETFDLRMEHSLNSLSKWEELYEKPFLTNADKSPEEMLDYVKCMCLDVVPDSIFEKLSMQDVLKINEYMAAKRSATWFTSNQKAPGNGEVVTSELIYYWMISYRIPMECANWHLNRLLTLIRIFSVKNQKPKKLSPAEQARQQRELNERRKAALKTNG